MLRDYQEKALKELYSWFETHEGHPCLVLPTGAGKSHIIAELCKDAIQKWPETRILMLTHVKELIEQECPEAEAPLAECTARDLLCPGSAGENSGNR